jgi:CheY-like chemotaxis protein
MVASPGGEMMVHPDILLVDDEEDVLRIAGEILREAGYRSQPAISGDVALIMLQQGLRFRLLITDIILPGVLDGFALARRAREFCPGIPIIYSTGYCSAAQCRARSAPHGETLVKPWGAEALLALVAPLLGGQPAATLAARAR